MSSSQFVKTIFYSIGAVLVCAGVQDAFGVAPAAIVAGFLLFAFAAGITR